MPTTSGIIPFEPNDMPKDPTNMKKIPWPSQSCKKSKYVLVNDKPSSAHNEMHPKRKMYSDNTGIVKSTIFNILPTKLINPPTIKAAQSIQTRILTSRERGGGFSCVAAIF